jgi:hypothetical protein
VHEKRCIKFWCSSDSVPHLLQQAAEEAELAKLEAGRAQLRAQRDVQAQQLEQMKARFLVER